MKRLIIALALFMPTSAMAGQITMKCEVSVNIVLLDSDILRYSEGIFYDTIELRVDGEWKEAEFPDWFENTRISDHSVTFEWTYGLGDYFVRFKKALDFFSGSYQYEKYKSPDGTDGSWERDTSKSYDCYIIK
ncbi:hypothetical protein OAL88_00325 [bacterium]|nr:hypothetical protein [bacterium]